MKRLGLTPHLASATLFLLASAPLAVFGQEGKSDPAMTRRADELLKRYDRNGDGKLDDDERAEAKEAMIQEQSAKMQARVQLGGASLASLRQRLLEKFDKNRDGRLDDEERAAAQAFAAEHGFTPEGEMRPEAYARFDRNKDGRLDEEERRAFIASMAEKLQQAPFVSPADEQTLELEKVLRAAIAADATQLKRYDTNANGRLDDAEWLAIKRRLAATPPRAEIGPEAERRRLEAVAAEVARRRKMREDATGPTPKP